MDTGSSRSVTAENPPPLFLGGTSTSVLFWTISSLWKLVPCPLLLQRSTICKQNPQYYDLWPVSLSPSMVTKAVPRNHLCIFKTINVTKYYQELHKFYTFSIIFHISIRIFLVIACVKVFLNSAIEHYLKIPTNLFICKWNLKSWTIRKKVYLLCTGCTNPAAFFQHEEFSRSNPKVYNNMNVQKWWGLKLILYFSEVSHYMYLNLTCLTFYA